MLVSEAATGKLKISAIGLRCCAVAALAVALLASAPPAFAVNPACGDAIRIAPGDTLQRVAAYCDTNLRAVLAANPAIRQPDRIEVGQLIYMPGRNAGAPGYAAPEVTAPRPPTSWGQGAFARCGSSVQVRRGDTFGSIARRCGISSRHLLAENPQLRDPNQIYAGMTLRVPPALASEPPRPAPVPVAQSLRVIGTITGEGVTCQALRGDDGTLYTIAGTATRPLRPGDRVEVTGTRAATTICQQGVAISASQILLLDGVARPSIDVTGTITREGITCTALRGDDGRLYTLTGQLAGIQPGDRVRISGDPVQTSYCQQGTTVNLRAIRPAF